MNFIVRVLGIAVLLWIGFAAIGFGIGYFADPLFPFGGSPGNPANVALLIWMMAASHAWWLAPLSALVGVLIWEKFKRAAPKVTKS